MSARAGDRFDKERASNKTTTTMTIMKYRPAHLRTMPFHGLLNDFFGRDIAHFLGSDDLPSPSPRVNIVEREGDFKLDLVAPGHAKEDLKLNVEDDTLTISADTKSEDLKENERFTRREFSRAQFKRSFRLPETANTEGITAEYQHGVLTVVIPKTEVSKPRTREISIA
jgi:HSP20 family protein